MPRRSDARQRMLESGATLFRERGVSATAFADVLAHSGAPRGSVYHHFPGGREQFSAEVVAYAGRALSRRISAAAPLGGHRLVDLLVDHWQEVLAGTDLRGGCPVAAAASEAAADPGARDAAGAAFAHWTDRLERALVADGVVAARARSLATLLLAAFEGAVLLARAQGSTAPVEAVRDELHAVLDGAGLPRD